VKTSYLNPLDVCFPSQLNPIHSHTLFHKKNDCFEIFACLSVFLTAAGCTSHGVKDEKITLLEMKMQNCRIFKLLVLEFGILNLSFTRRNMYI
jgi:hypothetical protein